MNDTPNNKNETAIGTVYKVAVAVRNNIFNPETEISNFASEVHSTLNAAILDCHAKVKSFLDSNRDARVSGWAFVCEVNGSEIRLYHLTKDLGWHYRNLAKEAN